MEHVVHQVWSLYIIEIKTIMKEREMVVTVELHLTRVPITDMSTVIAVSAPGLGIAAACCA